MVSKVFAVTEDGVRKPSCPHTLLLWIVRLVLPIALVVGLFVDGSLDQGMVQIQPG